MDADQINAGRERWQERFDAAVRAGRVADRDFTTLSGSEVAPVYGPADGDEIAGFERIGWPGEFPYTRGLYPTGYRGRTWTIRQFAGFGNAAQTNERYKMILGAGGGGLSVAFDMPTLMGRDSDDRRRWARWATAAWRSTPPPTWTCSSTASTWAGPPRR